MDSMEKVEEFIASARNNGASDEFVINLLQKHGWPARDVYAALGRYYERLTCLPVPERGRGPTVEARDAFLYLLAFSTLATWTIALGSLLFTFIDRSFPDPVAQQRFQDTRGSVSYQMASIIVAFPIFLFVMRFILREVERHPEMLESGIRKWLTYIALLIAAGIVIGDLITFLNYLLQGELTARFLLKVVTVLVISGTILVLPGIFERERRTWPGVKTTCLRALR